MAEGRAAVFVRTPCAAANIKEPFSMAREPSLVSASWVAADCHRQGGTCLGWRTDPAWPRSDRTRSTLSVTLAIVFLDWS